MRRAVQVVLTLFFVLSACQWVAAQEHRPSAYDYLVLATNKTSTMQDEMQEAADAGYAFAGVMGGNTSFGGSEVVVVMQRLANSTARFDQDVNHAEGIAGSWRCRVLIPKSDGVQHDVRRMYQGL